MHDLSGAIYQKICICMLWLDGLDLAIDSYQMRAFRMFLGLATHYTILMLGVECHTCAQRKMVMDTIR